MGCSAGAGTSQAVCPTAGLQGLLMATLRLPCSTVAPLTCLLAWPRRDLGGPVGLPRTMRGPRALLSPCKAPRLLLVSLPVERLAAREVAQLLSGLCPGPPAIPPAGDLTLGLGSWRFGAGASGARAAGAGASWGTYSCPTCTQAAREQGALVGRCERRGPLAAS